VRQTSKTCLDVVIENTLTSTLRVAEINASSNCLFTRVSDQLARQPALNVDICAIDKTAGLLDEALVDDYGLTTTTWDLASAPPSDVGVYDLVMASNLHEQGDLNQALRSIASITKDGGFVLIHDVTHHFGVVAAAFALTHDLAEFTDLASRSVGPYCDVDQWQKLVRLAGLEVVARKSDGVLSTLFLCRKVSTPAVSHQPRIINVSNLDCSWVDEVKAALSSDNALERVWLLAELTSLCGAVGLANCLRHESGGERVRLVLLLLFIFVCKVK
jgi:fatty acid synthase